ncbi:MAG TPA: DUF1127 domain-containing protein [Magnetospirillaceae bacterium]|jgi:uncharacterized protein YjiS (DUF1127 family)
MITRFVPTPLSFQKPQMDGDYFSSIHHKTSMWLIRFVDSILEGMERRRDRAALARMSNRDLQDIGLARTDIDRI